MIIGILAAIVIVSYNGITTQANNNAKISELKAFEKLYEVYKAQNGSYPQQSVTSDRYCFGTGFPVVGGVPSCYLVSSYNATYSYPENSTTATAIRSNLATVGKIPNILHFSVNGVMGPIAVYTTSYIDLITIIKADSINDCPGGTALSWPGTEEDLVTYGNRLECRIRLMK